MGKELTVTGNTKMHRLPKRGSYDIETIHKILDEGFVAHVGFTGADGQVFVIPTAYARRCDELLIHGSSASRMMRALTEEIEICVTVTLIDGLVLARSAFHHSMNYRSVVAFGAAKIIRDENEKMEALRLFTEHIVPGRWREVRSPTANELKATTVLALPLSEASAKIRTGNPVDDKDDYALNVWAGVLPFTIKAGEPVPDPQMSQEISQPDYITNYHRRPQRENE
ncbi:MAG: pyridoxamine 5'-phosphate oxidase family protein [Acidobacteriota bacterium]|nr:pyridoxamine 5'-phosphate oxidase family protein [Acidobacteriota bacterium]